MPTALLGLNHIRHSKGRKHSAMWGKRIFVFAGLAAALPVEDAKPTEADCPRTLCIDGLNECGTRWGGCYDVCQPTLSPTPPPCTTASPTITSLATTTAISSEPQSDCSTETVCWDGINECGQTYGGCFSACTPWPTFTPPPCTTSSSTTSSKDECSSRTVCADYINDCGMMYGGCFPDCSPWPTFTPPPCPSTTSLEPLEARATTEIGSSVTSDDCMTQTVCVDYVNDCDMMYGSCFPNCMPWPSVTPPPCPDTITSSASSSTTTSECNTSILRCEDYVNECGQWYGGCFPDCKPYPSFTAPPCPSDFIPSATEFPSPSTTYVTVSDTTAASTEVPTPLDEDECPWLCVDYLNECGRGYGGCFEACPGEPWPEFEDPGCPSTTTSSS